MFAFSKQTVVPTRTSINQSINQQQCYHLPYVFFLLLCFHSVIFHCFAVIVVLVAVVAVVVEVVVVEVVVAVVAVLSLSRFWTPPSDCPAT